MAITIEKTRCHLIGHMDAQNEIDEKGLVDWLDARIRERVCRRYRVDEF